MAANVCAFEKEHGIKIDKDNVVSSGLEAALKAEQRDQLIYAQAASKTRNYKLKELFTFLATEEQHHIESLSALKACLKKNGRWSAFSSSKQKLPSSIAGAAEETLEATGDEVEVVLAAMKGEKKAEEFYLKLAEHAPSKGGKDFFKQMAQIEARHFELLDKIFGELEDEAVKLA